MHQIFKKNVDWMKTFQAADLRWMRIFHISQKMVTTGHSDGWAQATVATPTGASGFDKDACTLLN